MLLFQLRDPLQIAAFAIVIILAFAYHEFAHAYVADRFGDPTPRLYGRMTLNPIPHLSLVGLVTLFLFGFGGAYTPVNPSMLRGNRRQSHALVAIAGPIANLIMASIFAILFRLWIANDIDLPLPPLVIKFITLLFYWGVTLNIFLAVFNMLPIPPLDGFTILQGVLPAELAYQIEPMRRYGMLILLGVLYFLPQITGINIFGSVISPITNMLESLLFGN